PMRGNFSYEAVNDLKAVFLVSLLPPFEAQLDPDFHVVSEEPNGMVELGLEIVRIDIRAELNLLHAAAGGFVAFVGFRFLVQKLAVVDDAADGRRGSGGNLDQVKLPFPRQLQRGSETHDAQLLLCVVYHPHFTGPDLTVSAVKGFLTLKLSEWL